MAEWCGEEIYMASPRYARIVITGALCVTVLVGRHHFYFNFTLSFLLHRVLQCRHLEPSVKVSCDKKTFDEFNYTYRQSNKPTRVYGSDADTCLTLRHTRCRMA
ncbi:hypothetical protein CBL_11031 [Carabus blaptoides fortunei]